jgi:hypothetical protein
MAQSAVELNTCQNLVAKATLITPSLAQNMLETSARTGFINRNISQVMVRIYAQQMKKGEWILSNDAICIDNEGAIINGQHRLQAIILSGCSVMMLVCYGIDRNAFSKMDRVKRRTDADNLSVLGVANNKTIAPGLRTLATYLSKGVFHEGGHGLIDAIHFFPLYEKYEAEFQQGVSFYQRQNVKRLTSAACVCLAVIFLSIEQSKAASFFEGFIKGENLASKNPILALRRQLDMLMGKNQGQRFTTSIALTIIAWNLFFNGEKRSTLRWINKEKVPVIEGFNANTFVAGLEYLF